VTKITVKETGIMKLENVIYCGDNLTWWYFKRKERK